MTRFKTPGFLTGAVLYEVNIRQFTPEGTFKAFMTHLPRLKNMGIDILWFMPIHPIGVLNRKGSLGSYYSIRNHQAVNPEFGTENDFKELVEACHHLGMKVIIDWVANHVSWDSEWATHHPEYIRQVNGEFVTPFDWTDVLQIEHQNIQQQDAMIEHMAFWIHQFDIDGFRADLPHLVPLEFWINARRFLDPVKPSLIWLGETEEPDYTRAFDITFTWKWMHATQVVLQQQGDVSSLVHLLQQDPLKGYRLYFTSNHDENSWNGTEFEKYGVYAQALAVFSALYPGAVPLVYSGQEIPNHARLPFFEKARLNWNEALLLESFYTQLFHIRHAHASFFAPETPITFFQKGGVLGYKIQSGDKECLVWLNLGKECDITQDDIFIPDITTWLMYERCEMLKQDTMRMLPGGYWVVIQ
ncbi:MAG: 1,4-alpha-glucan branching protein [Ferruginibacter sp.]|nr:1,4-alpha-glucan branching protein [Ferruginibacter sp.]